ncbi:MAG: NAD-dependent epimerase/dehydratase [Polyangiaceae bacterium]|jgi:NADH dehydrogenase|nr:NAD-dependent epimerase/dehydratase [Polyangiaceae bacterium]
MQGCEAVIHSAGIISETASSTFESVNVGGTRAIIAAAEAAGVRRLIYISSLGAERGESAYHASKREAEAATHRFSREWVVLRPGNVYGPGDQVISILLKMVRVVSMVPGIDGGDHPFQPIWVEDLGKAMAESVTLAGLEGRTLELAGPDRTSLNDLAQRLGTLTGRAAPSVPMPGFLAVLGARALTAIGIGAPLDGGQIQMMKEGNLLAPGQNALEPVFGITPTSLDVGLKRLADDTPEQTMDEGVGSLVRRHVWVDIVDSKLSSEALFERFCARFGEMTPWHVGVGVEPGSDVQVRYGVTLTMSLPLRGHVQVRVVELTATCLTLATLQGHALAGVVRFRMEQLPSGLRFHVEVHDRPASVVDWLAMSTAGGAVQVATWRATADKLLEESGGTSPDGVKSESEVVRGAERERVEAWAKSLVDSRLRKLHEQGVSEADADGQRA